MGAKSSPRNKRISLIVIHTNEGPNPPNDIGRDKSAEGLARYMDGAQVSYHKIVDDDSVVNYVSDDRASWSVRSGNPISLNLCFTGYAKQSRAEWLAHDNMLNMAANVVRDWCNRHGIPKLKISSSQVGNNVAGICGHVDWTVGKRDGTHTDPGGGFPWDVFIAKVNGGLPHPNTPTTNTGRRTLREGDTGTDIDALQRWAVRKYSYAKIAPLGTMRFGPLTKEFIIEFQKRVKIKPDGIVGPQTWAELEKEGFR